MKKALFAFAMLLPSIILAGGYHAPPPPPPPPTITAGFSGDEFSQALSMGFAAGAHELDFATYDHQISFTYAVPMDESEHDAYSFKYGKRFEFLPGVFSHITFTPEQGNELLGDVLIFGATLRIAQ